MLDALIPLGWPCFKMSAGSIAACSPVGLPEWGHVLWLIPNWQAILQDGCRGRRTLSTVARSLVVRLMTFASSLAEAPSAWSMTITRVRDEICAGCGRVRSQLGKCGHKALLCRRGRGTVSAVWLSQHVISCAALDLTDGGVGPPP